MPIVKCPKCKGKGYIIEVEPPGTKIGVSTPDIPFIAGTYTEETYQVSVFNCPNCGGSGCKWMKEFD